MSNRERWINRSRTDKETLWHNGRPFRIHGNTVEYGYLGSDFDNAVNEGFIGEEAARNPIAEDVLQVDKVDFLVADNVKKHHTQEYDITEGPTPQLVVRRGQQFTIRIDFTRPYDSAKDDLRLVFEISDNPRTGKGTLVQFALSDKDKEKQWGAKISQQSGKSLTVTVVTPPDCIVGKWRFRLHVVKKADNKTTVFRYNHKAPIYLLLNPWSKDDAVYMEEEERLAAYVLRDSGKLYVGSHKNWAARPWSFGQFSDQVLDCSMYLLDASELNWSWRGDPVHIARRLSAMVNSNDDDNGVIRGNWSGNYDGGKSPLAWTGSAPILEQYYREKRPVKYGQCWVYSGVLATVCRALGLPTRSVTNFESGHDQNMDVTIDLYFDENGDYLRNSDSIWNFHVWNEAWMARPDLPDGYGGWQAFDSTPQEPSHGVMCCGPCPVRAIKEGEVNTGYDGPFIFAEVNADKVNWAKQHDGTFKMVHVGSDEVGKLISTQSVGGDEREDLTRWYKYPEGSPEERTAVIKAIRKVKAVVEDPKSKDVKFQLTFDAENTFVGDEFKVDLHMKNLSTKYSRTVDGIFSVSTMYYTGVVSTEVKSLTLRDQVLKPEQERRLSVNVSPDIYLDKLEDCCMMSLYIMVKVKETQQIFTRKDNARLRKPHLDIKGPDTAKKDEEFKVEVSFTNPLNRTLTDCYLEVEGPGVTKAKTYPKGEVPPKATFATTIKLKPWKLGKREIVAVFNSRQLEDINGSLLVTIKE